MTLTSINPATGEIIAEYEEMSSEQIARAIAQAERAYYHWRHQPFAIRADKIMTVARILRSRTDEFARLMALEMGKPVAQGRAEVEKCAWNCEFYAQNAESLLSPEIVPTEASKSWVTFQPLGLILAVMPWNFPFWQVFRCAAPALMAGNALLLKHASNVSGCALAIEQAFMSAGFPEGLFKTLLVSSDAVSAVIQHPAVRGVAFTGSTPAGRAVASVAGAALKKTVLELGGSDPYIVLDDADLSDAASICASARLINSGQSCIAAKRFIVVRSRLNEFTRLLVEQMKSAKMGDPLREDTQVGPLARKDLRDELHRQVLTSVRMGATLLLGGHLPDGPGWFYPPTVLANVAKGMPAYHEETFGPVAAIIPAEDEEDAITKANDSPFGLGASVFTRDVSRAETIAVTRLEAGSCFVNASVRSDPRLPFGGVKESGYGRELSSYGIKEFTNIKTVYIR
jgi:succinate-semialdehyde dehydrogenase/glutarate-semialdehyde dehydrogenase